MELTQKENELLMKALTYYYENYIWGKLSIEDSNKSGEEDYEIRNLSQKLGIRELFPPEIRLGW